MPRLLAVLAAALIGTTACSQPPPGTAGEREGAARAPADDLLTVAERSNFRATARYDDVVRLLDALAASSPKARRLEMGTTEEGRSIPVLAIADPPVAAPEDLSKKKDRLVVLLLGGIHAGEVDGKEALPILAREILSEPGSPLLKDLVLLVAPVYNADGNERVGDVAAQRPGQAGPDEGGVGQRENARGLDLNRDLVKAEAAETRALLRFLDRWDPAIVVDTHTTNGSHHWYTVTYAGPMSPAGPRAVAEFVRDTMLPEVSRSLLESRGLRTFWYGNFSADRTRWETFGAEGRYLTNYVGLRNRIGILSEGYSYAPYRERVLGTRDFVRGCLEFAAANRAKIRALLAEADRAAVEAGRSPRGDDLVALRSRPAAAPGRATVLGYEEERRDGRLVATDREREYDVALVDRFEAERSRARPWAYLLPPGHSAVVEVLQRHGIEVEELREDLEVDAEVYRVDAVTRAVRPFQGHSLVTVDATPRPAARRVDAGTMVVRTAQRMGSLACVLLEPESDDGLAAWNFFDAALGEGAVDFPVLRVATAQPMTTGKARPLAEDRRTGRSMTFEAVYGAEGERAPDFAGSVAGIAGWLEDGETFLQVKEKRLRRVNARTGRSEPFHDPERMAAALAALPTIGAKKAVEMAERTSFQMTRDRRGALLEHENDLYYAAFDGSMAVRLTSTPQREELASFSPDGRFVAFVRDNDLYVVDVATQRERALTTGGYDRLRHGKNDWVYFEEVFNRNWRAYWWSPDSERIAFLRIDSTPVREFVIVGDVPEPQEVERVPYPKPGTPNPVATLGIVTVAGGDVKWMDAADYDVGGHLIVGVGWWPDSSAAWCYIQDRVQTWMDVCSVGTGGGKPRRLFRERTGAWVDPPPGPRFLEDGSFFFLSERSGYRHIYRYDRAGKPLDAAADGSARPITDGEWEVQSIARVDGDAADAASAKGEKEKPEDGARWVYFVGTADGWLTPHLYRVRHDGTGLERLTKEPGSHAVSVAPGGRAFVDTWSTTASPARAVVRSIGAAAEGGGEGWTRTLDSNPVHALEEYRLGRLEVVEIPLGEGRSTSGTLVYPPDFDPGRKYPVWFLTYGGPHAPTVSGGWAGGRVFEQVLAASGIVAFRADPWSASGRGAVSSWAAYKRLGVKELEDIRAIIRWLVDEHAWADAGRIGMSGHSYGGFMTAYAMTHSELFAAGIAGAPVTDWRDYDSIYTERLMLTPQENPEGYEATSVVRAAKNLHGRLLLLHGGMDDNVHEQNSIRLIKALQDAGRQFEYMTYPTARHGLSGKHYQRLMYEFIVRTMRPGDGTAPAAPAGEGAAGAGSAAGSR
jgi:dipeptidyl aminopeptidase/acylaminoacyl peptidase